MAMELQKGLKKSQNRVFLLRQNPYSTDVFFLVMYFQKSE